MKYAFLTGGCLGFTLTTVTDLLAGRMPDLVLRDAAIGCLAGALLLRWFWATLAKAFADTVNAKRAAEAAVAASAAATASATSKTRK